MAQSLEEIKAGMTAPDHKIVNGERVELTDEEAQAYLDGWAESERDRQLDEEANGYKEARQMAYPSIEDQLDEIFHNGIDSWKAIIQQVKDDNPKP